MYSLGRVVVVDIFVFGFVCPQGKGWDGGHEEADLPLLGRASDQVGSGDGEGFVWGDRGSPQTISYFLLPSYIGWQGLASFIRLWTSQNSDVATGRSGKLEGMFEPWGVNFSSTLSMDTQKRKEESRIAEFMYS